MKNTERSQINNLMQNFNLLEKHDQAKPKTSRKRDIIKAEIKKIGNNNKKHQKRYRESTKQKAGSLKKINKIDKPLANLMKMRKAMTQISKIRNEKAEITANTKEIQGIIRDNFENLYSNTLENPEEMNKFLDTYDHQN
jgi:uncharacterized protein (DUF3084 family)